MNLKQVTLTGADDSVNPSDLVEISKEYGFVEWGILLGSKGGTRFPTKRWIEDLLKVAPTTMNLSAHLCGHFVTDALIFDVGPNLDPKFQRTQVNTHGALFNLYGVKTKWIKGIPQKVIFQCDGVNDDMIHGFTKMGLGSPLFDTSSGAGVLPKDWPKAWQDTYCGYAGGLDPTNVVEELKKIDLQTSGQPFWIDMETRVRSNRDAQFNLGLCREVLEAVKPFIGT
jgi:hypothetical protein